MPTCVILSIDIEPVIHHQVPAQVCLPKLGSKVQRVFAIAVLHLGQVLICKQNW